MASLDFVIDLLEKIESQKMGYYLLISQREKKGYKFDAFYSLDSDYEVENFVKVNDKVVKDLKKKYGIRDTKKKGNRKK
jgi:hypothetical protein